MHHNPGHCKLVEITDKPETAVAVIQGQLIAVIQVIGHNRIHSKKKKKEEEEVNGCIKARRKISI